MKIEDVCNKLRAEGISAINVNRIEKLAKEFATVEAFFSTTRGAIMGVWNKMHPGSGKSLGNEFFAAYDKALAVWKRGDEPKAERAAKPAEDMSWLSHELTTEEMKKILDFMELFGVKAMSFSKIATLLDLTGTGGQKDA